MEKTNKKNKGSSKYGFFAFFVAVLMLAAIIPQVTASGEDLLSVKINTKNKVTEGVTNVKVTVVVKNTITNNPAKARVTVTGLFNAEKITNNKGKAIFYYTAPTTAGYPLTQTIRVTAKEISESHASPGYVSGGIVTLRDGEVNNDMDFGFIPLYSGEATKSVIIRPRLTITFQANRNVDRSEMLSLPVPSTRQAITVMVTSHGRFIDGATVKLRGGVNSNSWPLIRTFNVIRQQSNGGVARYVYTIPNVEQTETYKLVFEAKKTNYAITSNVLQVRISP